MEIAAPHWRVSYTSTTPSRSIYLTENICERFVECMGCQWGWYYMQQLAEIKIFSNEQCTEGGIVEGVREYLTKQQPLVLCLNGWYTIQPCRLERVCVCAVHLTVNLRSIVGQGEEEDPSCTSSDAYPRMMSYAPKIGGPGKNKMKIIHETDNAVINNHISNHEISQRSTDRRRRHFSDLSPMPSFQSMPPLARISHIRMHYS